jgi:glucosamine-6-phosphate deaminase
MRVIICKDYDAMSAKAGEIFAERIKAKPGIVLGLATGTTPIGLYNELAKRNKGGEITLKDVKTFNLDEYVGLAGDHVQSYRYFMDEKLFNHVDIDKANTHVLDGKAADLAAGCADYEKRMKDAGGVDLQLLGIGSNGHIGFAEPGSPKDGRTAVVDLTESTIKDNSRLFDSEDEVPKQALSMGIGTILDAGEVVLVANKENKADAIVAAIEGEPSADCPASFLQEHANVTFVLDEAAASKLQKKDEYERA